MAVLAALAVPVCPAAADVRIAAAVLPALPAVDAVAIAPVTRNKKETHRLS